MTPYKNLSGNSGIEAYELGEDSITIKFVSGGVYLYDYATNGKEVIEGMKILAEAGKGLSAFVGRYLRDKHAKKLSD